MSSVSRRSLTSHHGRHGLCPGQLQGKHKETQEENVHEVTREFKELKKNNDVLYSSTFHLDESSMDSSVCETPPLARRHSQGLRGSKLNSICLGEGEIDQSKPQLEYLIFFQMI